MHFVEQSKCFWPVALANTKTNKLCRCRNANRRWSRKKKYKKYSNKSYNWPTVSWFGCLVGRICANIDDRDLLLQFYGYREKLFVSFCAFRSCMCCWWRSFHSIVVLFVYIAGRVDMTEITMQRIFDYFFLYLMAMQSKREPSQAAANIRREQKKKKFACVSERGRGRTESCNNHHICCMPIWPTTTHLDIFMGISFSFVRIWLAHPIILVSYHLSTRSI